MTGALTSAQALYQRGIYTGSAMGSTLFNRELVIGCRRTGP